MHRSNLTCIAIDDDPLFLLKIESLIEQIEWLDLLAKFTNPVEAASDIIAKKPDLLLLDIEMPYVDGYQLLDWIEPYLMQIETRPKTIIITGKEELLNKKLNKPIDGKILKSDLKSAAALVDAIPKHLFE